VTDVILTNDDDAIQYLAYFSGDRHASMDGEQRQLAEMIALTTVRLVRGLEQSRPLLGLSFESILIRGQPSCRHVSHVKQMIDLLNDRFNRTAVISLVNASLPLGFYQKPWWAEVLACVLSLPSDTDFATLQQLLPKLAQK
jgi:hypothetical protein